MDTKVQSTPTIPGTPYKGGFYAGRALINGATHAIIVSPQEEGTLLGPWNSSDAAVEGASSYCDGHANTLAMATAGSELAKAALNIRAGGYDDWYIPSRDELEIIYRNLKPGTYAADMFRAGDNPSSVPAGYPYTMASPAQTTDTAFQEDGSQALETAWYWSSTQLASNPDYAWLQHFYYGYQDDFHKSNEGRARAVRRELIIE